MKMKFGVVINGTVGLRIEVASPQDWSIRRGLQGRRPMRQAISPSNQYIDKNKDGEVNIDHEHDATFRQH
jgi:hypothetical protein